MHTAQMLYFTYTRLNLYLDLFPVMEFQHFIALWKALAPANSNLQKQLQHFQNLNVHSRKTKNVQIPFKGRHYKNLCKISLRKLFNLFALL